MKLSEKQHVFTANVAKLIAWAWNQGYRLSFGEAWRPSETAALYAKQGRGVSRSTHSVRLAVDLNLFVDGVYQPDTAAHKPLGAYWKSLHPLNRWGGDFKRQDGNHYSMEHEGVQ